MSAIQNISINPFFPIDWSNVSKIPSSFTTEAEYAEINAEPVVVETVDNPELPTSPGVEIPPAVKKVVIRVAEAALRILKSVVGALVFFGMAFLLNRVGYLGAATDVIKPLPFVLMGLAAALIYETGLVIYQLTRKFLAQDPIEETEETQETQNLSRMERFREHCWTVIHAGKYVLESADVVFSRLFRIDTMKKLREEGRFNHELYLMEMVRKAFCAQIKDSFKMDIPQQLGMTLVTKCGFAIVGSGIFIGVQGLMFVFDVLKHFNSYLESQHATLRRMQYTRADETKTYAKILEQLYPAEFAALDALEGMSPAERQAALSDLFPPVEEPEQTEEGLIDEANAFNSLEELTEEELEEEFLEEEIETDSPALLVAAN